MSDKESAARTLAELHYQFEPGMREIYRLLADDQTEQEPDEPIKLLEVNQDTIPSGIMPLGFDGIPASGNYPTVIIQITTAWRRCSRDTRNPLPGCARRRISGFVRCRPDARQA